MKTHIQTTLTESIAEGRAHLDTATGIRKSIAAMVEEKRNLATRITAILEGVGDAAKLGVEAAGLAHAGEIIDRRIIAAQDKIKHAERAAGNKAYAAHSAIRSSLDEWNLTIRKARGAALSDLCIRWKPLANWEMMLNKFLEDSADFTAANDVAESLKGIEPISTADSTIPTYSANAAAAIFDLGDEALTITAVFPPDVAEAATQAANATPATTAAPAKKAA